MPRRWKLFLVLLACLLACLCASAAQAESEGMVRVKLTRLNAPASVTLSLQCDYCLNGAYRLASGSKLTVTAQNGSLIVSNGSRSADAGRSFTLLRASGGAKGARFTSPSLANSFCGDFAFTLESGRVAVVMNAYVEDYLYGVVGYEMSNSYPMEALKAQAVAARTYVLRMKLARTGKSYDVLDTASDQVFKGYNASQSNVIAAVNATKGVVLGYNGKLAACYYTASNGGQTESTKNAWGTSLAYSAVKDDPYDLESGATCRSVTLKKDQTGQSMNASLRAALLKGLMPNLEKYHCSTDPDVAAIDQIVSVEPVNPRYAAPSRVYRALRFTVHASSVTEDGTVVDGNVRIDVPTFGGFEDWFCLGINASDNETVWVEDLGDSFRISFRRYGHGIGMSQRGAQVMAKNYGMTADQILDFYYPGTKAYTLTLTDLSGSGVGTRIETPADAQEALPEPEELPADERVSAETAEPEPVRAAVTLSTPGSTLCLRAQPSQSAQVLKNLKDASEVDVYALEGDWALVVADGTRGYAAARYLRKVEELQTTESVPTQETTPAPESAPAQSVCAQVALNGANSTLMMRVSPNTSASVVARLKNGALLTVTSASGNWVYAEDEAGHRGYVCKTYLKKADSPAQPDGALLAEAVRDTFAYLYADDGSHAIVGLNKGDTVTVLDYNDQWARVRFGASEGYVPVKDLKKAN